MPNLIIHTATRIIHCMTTAANPDGFDATKQTLISVADDYALQGPDRKLGLDNSTQSLASATEISAMKDDYDPGRGETRELKQAGTDLFASAQTLASSTGGLVAAQVRAMASDLKTFMVKLNNWVKAPV